MKSVPKFKHLKWAGSPELKLAVVSVIKLC